MLTWQELAIHQPRPSAPTVEQVKLDRGGVLRVHFVNGLPASPGDQPPPHPSADGHS